MPEAAVPVFLELMADDQLQLKITPHRISKSGDFRAPYGGQPARITVNGTLNPFAFLITLIHEFAHYHAWLNHRHAKQSFTLRRTHRPLPHGKEWKIQFNLLMQPLLNEEVFPADVLQILQKYLENPKASTGADHILARTLRRYDPPDHTLRLEELPPDALFTINGKRNFRKKEQLRKRYRCICLNTNKVYLVSANAPVELLGEHSSGR